MRSRAGRVRTASSAVLGVLAVPVIVAAMIAVWARATVFSTSEVVALSRAALDEPDVQAGLAEWLTTEIFTNVDVQGPLTEALPADREGARAIVDVVAQRAVQRALQSALADDDTQRVLSNVVGVAHHRTMDLLKGDGLVDGISVDDGAVSLNMLPLLVRGMSALEDAGVTDAAVPTLPEGSEPPEQIAALESATGRDLPDSFGQLVVYRSDAVAEREQFLDNVQRVVAVSRRALWLLLALAVGLPLAAVGLARDRLRASLWLSLAIVVAMVLLRSAVERIVDEGPEVARTLAGRSAAEAILDGASTSLLRLSGAVILAAGAVGALAIVERRRFVDDLLLSGAVVVGAVIVAVVGLHLTSLLAAMAIAAALYFLVRARVA